MLGRFALIAVAAFLAAAAPIPKKAASPPPPAQPSQQTSHEQDRGTASDPVFVQVVEPQKTQQELDADKAKENEAARREQQLVELTGKLADYTLGLYRATFLLVLVTCGLVVFGYRQLHWMSQAENTTRDIQRAYVKLSHLPPGIVGLDGGDIVSYVTGSISMTVEVRNHGHSPARVTDVFLKVIVTDDPLPDEPDYSGDRATHDATRGFLVSEDSFTHYREWSAGAEGRQSLDKARDGKLTLYVIGYVDYIDAFDRRHRGGYARVFDPAGYKTNNSLLFISNAGYNYDRPRKRGEGRDWDNA